MLSSSSSNFNFFTFARFFLSLKRLFDLWVWGGYHDTTSGKHDCQHSPWHCPSGQVSQLIPIWLRKNKSFSSPLHFTHQNKTAYRKQTKPKHTHTQTKSKQKKQNKTHTHTPNQNKGNKAKHRKQSKTHTHTHTHAPQTKTIKPISVNISLNLLHTTLWYKRKTSSFLPFFWPKPLFFHLRWIMSLQTIHWGYWFDPPVNLGQSDR